MGMLWLLVKQRRTQKSETDTSENHNWTQNKDLIQGQLRTLALGSELEDRHQDLDGETADLLKKLQFRLFSNDQNSVDWLNYGLKELNGIIQNYFHEDESDYRLLRQIVRYSKSVQGALYLIEADFAEGAISLQLKAGYGLPESLQKNKVEIGEGMIGQIVLDKEPYITENIPEDYTIVSSGLGESVPAYLGIFPLIFKDDVYGAIECSFLAKPEKRHLKFIEAAAACLGAHFFNINIAKKQKLQLDQLKAQQEQLWELQKQQQEAYLQMEKSLERMEAEKRKNEAILEGCSDGFLSFRTDGKIEFANKAVGEILGYEKTYLLSLNITEILPVKVISQNNQISVCMEGDVKKEIKEKTELQVFDANKNEISLLVSLNVISYDNKLFLTFFIQKISIDMF